MVSSVRVKDDRVLVQARTESDIVSAHSAIGGLVPLSEISRNGTMRAFGFEVDPQHSAAAYVKALNIPEAAVPAISNLLNQAIVVAKTKETLAGLNNVTHEAAHTAPDQFVANLAGQRAHARETTPGIA